MKYFKCIKDSQFCKNGEIFEGEIMGCGTYKLKVNDKNHIFLESRCKDFFVEIDKKDLIRFTISLRRYFDDGDVKTAIHATFSQVDKGGALTTEWKNGSGFTKIGDNANLWTNSDVRELMENIDSKMITWVEEMVHKGVDCISKYLTLKTNPSIILKSIRTVIKVRMCGDSCLGDFKHSYLVIQMDNKPFKVEFNILNNGNGTYTIDYETIDEVGFHALEFDKFIKRNTDKILDIMDDYISDMDPFDVLIGNSDLDVPVDEFYNRQDFDVIK